MIPPDPTEEILAIRRALAAQFGNDIHRICEDIRRQERESGHTYITLPPRRPEGENELPPAQPRAGAA